MTRNEKIGHYSNINFKLSNLVYSSYFNPFEACPKELYNENQTLKNLPIEMYDNRLVLIFFTKFYEILSAVNEWTIK